MINFSKEWNNSTTELDFEKHWSSINVHQEVLRGIELREQKPKTNGIEHDFVDIHLPSCSKSPERTSPRRRGIRRASKKNRMKKKSKLPSCPLRVVELAEPSKRHCLNTWKNNSKTLPNYMVDRLRKHVMDEKPVVRISEAANYFKNNKKKTLSKKSSPRNNKIRPKKVHDMNMLLCSLFGYKIKHRLITPINIILNEELEKINHVVTDEIIRIIRRKEHRRNNIYKNDKILSEMAKKVTIWIANILEETSYKQLLEQLEEMEEEEGPVLDILDELLENVQVICKSTSSSDSDLNEGNESESLSTKNEDVTESVFENISKEITSFKESDSVMTPNENEISSDENEKTYDTSETQETNEKLGMEQHISSLLDETINNIFDSIEIDSNNIMENKEETDLLVGIENKVSDLNESKNNTALSTDHDYGSTEDIAVMEPDAMNVENFIHPHSNSSPVDNVQEQNDNKSNSIAVAIDELNILTAEDIDEETKKVKFSNIDLANRRSWSEINNRDSPTPTFEHKESIARKSSKEYIISHFNVAPPNANLLSYIDEVWPEYILPPLLKVTESVNKSVTSMGNIIEIDDENLMKSPTEHYTIENIDKVSNEQMNTAIINLRDQERIIKINENKDVEKSNNYYSNEEFVKDGQERPLAHLPSIGRQQSTLEQLSIHFPIDKDKIVETIEDLEISNISNKELAKDSRNGHARESSERKKEKHTSSLDKLSMNKVQIPKMPSSHEMVHVWTKQSLQKREDVNNIKPNMSMLLQLEQKHEKDYSKTPNNIYMTETRKVQTNIVNVNKDEFCTESHVDIRKWCMGLLNVTENLAMWTSWIQNVCLNVTYLNNEGMNCRNGPSRCKHVKKIMKLKKNIDVDIQLWSQLQRRLRRGLRKYKNSYHMTRKVTPIQANKIKCKCQNSSQKNPSCAQILFKNYYKATRKI